MTETEQYQTSNLTMDFRAGGMFIFIFPYLLDISLDKWWMTMILCCRGELRLCLTGTCEKVGCDLKLRSSSMLDRCGVCGGDGTTCPTRHVHTWTMHKLSICSATCGGSEAISVIFNFNFQVNVKLDIELDLWDLA